MLFLFALHRCGRMGPSSPLLIKFPEFRTFLKRESPILVWGQACTVSPPACPWASPSAWIRPATPNQHPQSSVSSTRQTCHIRMATTPITATHYSQLFFYQIHATGPISLVGEPTRTHTHTDTSTHRHRQKQHRHTHIYIQISARGTNTRHLVILWSSESNAKNVEVLMFSLMTMTPFSRRPEPHLLKNSVSSASGRWPVTLRFMLHRRPRYVS